MTRKETTGIALKCFAIYLVAQMIIALPALVGISLKLGYFGNHDVSAFFMVSLCFLTVVASLLCAFLLWKVTNSLMEKETTPESAKGELSVDETMKLILACMGIYFAINAVIAFPQVFVNFKIAQNTAGQQSYVSASSIVSVVLQLVFGCLLVAKPAKWVKMIRSIKEK